MLTVNEIVIAVVGYKMEGREDWHELVIFTLRKDHPELYEEYQQWDQQNDFKILHGSLSASASTHVIKYTTNILSYKRQAKIIEILKRHCTLQNVAL